jgi:glucans biosynthesis protein
MTNPTDRRSFMGTAALTAAVLAAAGPARRALAAGDELHYGAPEPFSFELLIERARQSASAPYRPPPRPDPAIVAKIDYDAHGKLHFKPEYALYGDGPGAYPVTFMHVGMYFPKSVRMHRVTDGTAREILYSQDYFTMPADHVAKGLAPEPSALAGLWLRESRLDGDWEKKEPWATFLGASYFRAVGELGQVGQSARGIALGTGDPGPEEFPDFVSWWIEEGPKASDPVLLHALLDGPSIAGAYRFAVQRGKAVVMDIDAHLFPRNDIARMGIAPLTSMFWYGEYGKGRLEDWRPEVHDADGLVMWNGAGEHLWRPLNNPTRIVTSSFVDTNPKGFGLSQRDRDFEHYLDGVNYHLRPDTWVEPVGEWGKGAVQLVEIPTDDEIYDNIVTFWVPEQPIKGGSAHEFHYKLHWLATEPYFPPDLARTVATRMGRGGEPGKPRPQGVVKFMIEFDGAVLATIPDGQKPKAVVSASRGSLDHIYTEEIPYRKRWRASFDLTLESADPVELRLFLQMAGKPISETWLYQFQPPAAA